MWRNIKLCWNLYRTFSYYCAH